MSSLFCNTDLKPLWQVYDLLQEPAFHGGYHNG